MTKEEIVAKVDSLTEILQKTTLDQFGISNAAGHADVSKEQLNIILLAIAHTVIPYLRAIGHKDTDSFLAYLKVESDERIQEVLWQTLASAQRPASSRLN